MLGQLIRSYKFGKPNCSGQNCSRSRIVVIALQYMTISWNRGCDILAHIKPFFIGLYERNYLHTPRSTECFTWITHVSFFICNSIAIDFGIDCSSISSKALRPFHLTEVTKLFNRFTSQRLLPTHGKIHFNKTLGLDKLI